MATASSHSSSVANAPSGRAAGAYSRTFASSRLDSQTESQMGSSRVCLDSARPSLWLLSSEVPTLTILCVSRDYTRK